MSKDEESSTRIYNNGVLKRFYDKFIDANAKKYQDPSELEKAAEEHLRERIETLHINVRGTDYEHLAPKKAETVPKRRVALKAEDLQVRFKKMYAQR